MRARPILATCLVFVATALAVLMAGCPQHGVALEWTASTTPGVTYDVYRRVHGTAAFAVIGGSSTLTYVDTAVSAGTEYDYEVTAILNGVQSVPSNIFTVTVP